MLNLRSSILDPCHKSLEGLDQHHIYRQVTSGGLAFLCTVIFCGGNCHEPFRWLKSKELTSLQVMGTQKRCLPSKNKVKCLPLKVNCSYEAKLI